MPKSTITSDSILKKIKEEGMKSLTSEELRYFAAMGDEKKPAVKKKKISADSLKKGTALDPGYASRVQGKDATGEYLSPEERKAQFKKTKITGADIKRTGAIGSAEKTVKADTTGASALAIQKPKGSGDVAKAEDVTPQDQAQPTESLIGPLKTIDNSVNGIVETLKKSNKADAKAQSDARKAAEKKARAEKEGKLEGIKGKLADAAQTVLKPVTNIFKKIWDFLKLVFLGRVVMKLFEWFTDDANKQKIASLFRFLKDWWPVLVAGIMAIMGPGMIFTAGLIALLVWGIPKIIEAVKWVGSLFGIGVDKELKNVQDESTKFGEETASGIEKEGVAPKEEGGEETKAEVGDTEAPATDVTPPEVSETQQQAKDVQAGADNAEPLQMAGGGHVPGSGSGDTVPAMLTPGEFVMSKGAVQRYGSGTLAGMNAAAGGTNRPKRGGYKGGGTVQNVSNISSSSFKNVSNTSNGGMSIGGPKIHYSGGGLVNNLTGSRTINETIIPKQTFHFAGGGAVTEEQAKIVKSSPSQIVINPPPGFSPEVITEDPEGEANIKLSNRPSSNQELPSFSADKMRSMSKIKTLGITV